MSGARVREARRAKSWERAERSEESAERTTLRAERRALRVVRVRQCAALHHVLRKLRESLRERWSTPWMTEIHERAVLCATTLSSLDAAVVTRRRRRMTSFAFPSGGRAIGRVSTPPSSDALCDAAARRRVRRLHLRLRLRGLRPERAAAAAPDGKDCIGIASHASDADCDDGGPGSEFQQADCPYGSDCQRMPRFPPRAARRARVALAAAFSIVGC
jgi:hypothetical protein